MSLAGAGQSADVKTSLLYTKIALIRELRARVAIAVDAALITRERLYGSEPRPAQVERNPSPPTPVPNGILDEMQKEIDLFAQTIETLHEHLKAIGDAV